MKAFKPHHHRAGRKSGSCLFGAAWPLRRAWKADVPVPCCGRRIKNGRTTA